MPVQAVEVFFWLINHGYTLDAVDGVLRLGREDGSKAAKTITDLERASITKWKPHLIELVLYGKRTDLPEPKR